MTMKQFVPYTTIQMRTVWEPDGRSAKNQRLDILRVEGGRLKRRYGLDQIRNVSVRTTEEINRNGFLQEAVVHSSGWTGR